MQLLGKLETRAREQLPRAHFDYFAGGAGDEQTLADNVAAWRRVWIAPRVMVDVSAIDTSCTLLGRRLALPLLLAPMSAQRLLHPDGELAAARAAGEAGTVFCLSTRATADLAEVAGAAPGPLWFQLYVDRDRARSEQVLARAAEHGYEAVVLTVDLPVAGRRERELRHGEFAFPDGIALTSHLGMPGERRQAPIGGYDMTLTWPDVAWAHAASGLPVIVKGVLRADDAELAIDAGAARDRRLQPRRPPGRRLRADGRRAARRRGGGRGARAGARRRRHPRRRRRPARAGARRRRRAGRAAVRMGAGV